MSKFKVIAWDVYKKNIKSVSFLIMILAPFLLVGFITLIQRLAGDFEDVNKIGIVAENSAMGTQMKQLSSDDYTFVIESSEKAAQKSMNAEDIDAYIKITGEGTDLKATLYSESSLGTATEMILQQFLTTMQSSARAQSLGLSTEEVASLSENASFTRQKVSFEDDKMVIGEDNSQILYWISYGAGMMLWVIIISYSSILAQEVASEKGSRIMEVILSSTTAQTHYYGKIVGVLLVAVTQLLLWGVMGFAGYEYFKDSDIVQQFMGNVSLEHIIGSFLVFTVIFIILGVLIFSILSALCGSLVNRAEDTSKAILPVMYLGMAGFFISILLGSMAPNNIIVRVTSYIPFFSSFTMPVRLANDTVSVSGAMISVGILVVSTIALMLFSARVYKSNVLVYSEGGLLSSLKQSISIMQNEKQAK